MRYDKIALFTNNGTSKYDPELGGHPDVAHVSETYYCNATDMGTELKAKVFGKINVNGKILRFRGVVPDINEYEWIVYNGKKYKVIDQKTYRFDTALYLEELME